MKPNIFFLLCIVSTATLCNLNAYAGGPLELNPNDPNNVERWPNGGANIPFNPDLGGLGTLDNTQAVEQVEAAFNTWQNIETASASYSNNGTMPFDIDASNFMPFAGLVFDIPAEADGLSPIIFDEDGSIFDTIFGLNSGVLGFASIEVRDENGIPIEGVAFLNGGALSNLDDLLSVQVHEYGHYSGLAHTVVNGQSILFSDNSGPTESDGFGPSPLEQTETMYPFIISGGGQQSIHEDEKGMYSFLYPTEDFFANSATITGSVILADGQTPVSGVNVIARSVDNPFSDAHSSISGDRGITGQYTLNGLTPNTDYVIYVDQILQGGFSTTPINLPSSEEYYNGDNESSDGASDDPTQFTPVSVASGQTVDNIDIIFNNPAPNVPLNLGDDGFEQILLPFEFTFCGKNYHSVFISANGNVTFEQSLRSDYSESTVSLLNGPPRIAILWDDLNPAAGGSVSYDQNPLYFSIRWENVPEYPDVGQNTAEIRLHNKLFNITRLHKGNGFELLYESIDSADHIAGFSCGAAITSTREKPSDLSRVKHRKHKRLNSAKFEVFSSTNPNDLVDLDSLHFRGTQKFRDRFEPNNSLRRSRLVSLPFSTEKNSHFTEISPAGGDVDYFSFYAHEGTTLVAQSASTQLDLLLGLFNRKGELIATGTYFSAAEVRLNLEIPASGLYSLAVTTAPDTEFVGAGESGDARYVLNAQVFDGTMLTLSDDDSEELALEFNFPFHGQERNRVFVNSNGNLTFDEADTSAQDSLQNLIQGPSRLAPLWSDLNPAAGGVVIFKSTTESATVSFHAVPEYASTNSNSFSVTLNANGQVTFDYQGIEVSGSTVGSTEGMNATNQSPVDLSAETPLLVNESIFELFNSTNPFDLNNSSLLFE
ncbi:MAG: fibronectin type III domain-containing protein [Spongiibacteraceae bacterium]|nr:fibronectin type III domain-containing protein [Spongiibacteraceae bacterium]